MSMFHFVVVSLSLAYLCLVAIFLLACSPTLILFQVAITSVLYPEMAVQQNLNFSLLSKRSKFFRLYFFLCTYLGSEVPKCFTSDSAHESTISTTTNCELFKTLTLSHVLQLVEG